MTAERGCDRTSSMGVEDAARYLGIPLLAIGQLMFEGRLNPGDGFSFQKDELDKLKQVDLSGYR